ATRHTIVSAALLAPLLAIALAALDPPNPLARAGVAMPVEIAMQPLALAPAAPASPDATILLYVWAAGSALLLARTLVSIARWSRIARRAIPLRHTLFELASRGLRTRLAVTSEASEPMVAGIWRPVVLLPDGYLESLDGCELASVFAHELEHVRRRDNASALVHELVCALFWFDPLHWLARRRLLDLRERACDERVIEAGCEPRAYITALARSCHAAVQSPAVACMSGFHVRERMDSIMSYASSRSRLLPQRIVRGLALTIAAALIAVFAFIAPAPPAFAANGGEYQFAVSIEQGTPRFIHITVVSPEGVEVISSRVAAGPEQPFQVNSFKDGRTYKVSVTPEPGGDAKAVLEVHNEKGLLHRDEKTIPIEAARDSQAQTPPYRIGGDIRPPKILHRVDPIYTPEAKAAHIGGVVVLETTIDELGNVVDPRPLKPLPKGLTEAAIEAVRQWKFEPPLKDGKPVRVLFNITINFKLDDEKRADPPRE
ncbi:MAG TPA: M56 family metallopeptidase, partial [Thermoanaerobaculia bacterium]|nr:M56 family metallopeptidase [Thermoanaerobaculia bacterium]